MNELPEIICNFSFSHSEQILDGEEKTPAQSP